MNAIKDFSPWNMTDHSIMAEKARHLVNQQGAALVVSLIMLLLMTLVGITAMQVTTVQEKMVANNRDSNVAFQAAETALKRGESYIKQLQIKLVAFSNDCKANAGLCRPSCSTIVSSSSTVGIDCWNDSATPTAQWSPVVRWAGNSTQTMKYGSEAMPAGGGVADISELPTSSVAKQPRFMIEDITPQGGGGVGTAQQSINSGWYRITAQGYGQAQDENGEPLARVMLQSIFKRLQ